MRSRGPVILALLALVALVACDQATTPAPTEEEPPAEDGGVPEDDPQAEREAEARRYEGEWSGMWTNKTFGSTGSASASVTVGDDGETMTIVLDLGGGVFGASDPPPENIRITLDGSGSTSGSSDSFGPYEASWDVDAGTISITLGDVPGDRITTVSGSGTFSDSTFTVDFTINFSDGSSAESTLELAKS